jgi:hypothetical protein
MRLCCPPGRGCNSSAGDEPCALKLCRLAASDEPLAALALARWEEWNLACRRDHAGRSERRFRRRAYERARDAALVAVLMRRARVPAARRTRGKTTRRRGAFVAEHRAGQRR